MGLSERHLVLQDQSLLFYLGLARLKRSDYISKRMTVNRLM